MAGSKNEVCSHCSGLLHVYQLTISSTCFLCGREEYHPATSPTHCTKCVSPQYYKHPDEMPNTPYHRKDFFGKDKKNEV
jgi:hypothetical protein